MTASRTILLPPSSARRDEVLDGLIELFLAEGFASLNVSLMASRLRCSKSTLYLVAQSKEQIVLAAVRLYFKRAAERVESQVAVATDPTDRLRTYLEAVSAQLRPAGPEFIDDLARFVPAREIYGENTQIAARRVQEIVVEGVRAGVMRQVDATFVGTAVAQVMIAIQDGGIEQATGLNHAEAYHQLADFVLHSLIPTPAGTARVPTGQEHPDRDALRKRDQP